MYSSVGPQGDGGYNQTASSYGSNMAPYDPGYSTASGRYQGQSGPPPNPSTSGYNAGGPTSSYNTQGANMYSSQSGGGGGSYNQYGSTHNSQAPSVPPQRGVVGSSRRDRFVYLQNLPKLCQPKDVVDLLSKNVPRAQVKRCVFDYDGADVVGAHVEVTHSNQASDVIAEAVAGRLLLENRLVSAAMDQYPPPDGSDLPGMVSVSSGPPPPHRRSSGRGRGGGRGPSRDGRRDRPY